MSLCRSTYFASCDRAYNPVSFRRMLDSALLRGTTYHDCLLKLIGPQIVIYPCIEQLIRLVRRLRKGIQTFAHCLISAWMSGREEPTYGNKPIITCSSGMDNLGRSRLCDKGSRRS